MGTDAPAPVVTISATYGSGGSIVARRVADELGLPFLDRAIPGAVAAQLGVSVRDAEARDEVGPRGLERIMRSLAAVGPVSGVDFAADFHDRTFCDATEQAILRHVESGGGVVLGRAGAVVLGDRPSTLHVRLDGPVERRVEQAMRIERIDRPTAERRRRDNDAARAAYVREFYGADAADPALYHLVLDATTLDLDVCVDVIACAARALFGAPHTPPA
jgi:cytidylate kinase